MMHTKGPWTNEEFAITADDGSVIADVHSIDDFPCIEEDNNQRQLDQLTAELEANARLISAAPELLEACKAVLESIWTVTDHCAVCGGDASRREHASGCVIVAVQAAIAKAEAES